MLYARKVLPLHLIKALFEISKLEQTEEICKLANRNLETSHNAVSYYLSINDRV